MASSGDFGEKRSFGDKFKHPDLFPELRGKLKGTPPSRDPTTSGADIHPHLQKHTSTKPRKDSTTSRAKSANSITSSTPTTATMKSTSRKPTTSATASLRATASSRSRPKEMGTRSNGTLMVETTSGPCQWHWRRRKRQSTSRTGG